MSDKIMHRLILGSPDRATFCGKKSIPFEQLELDVNLVTCSDCLVPKHPPTIYLHAETLHEGGGEGLPYPSFSWCDERQDDSDHEYTGGPIHSFKFFWCTTPSIFRVTSDETRVTCPVCLERIAERNS